MTREQLNTAADTLVSNLKITMSKIVVECIGFGSLYNTEKTQPGDADVLIKLGIKFANLQNLMRLSDIVEFHKERYPKGGGGYYLNVFIEDADGKRLDSVDLWFANRKENTVDKLAELNSSIVYRKYLSKWNINGKKLL